MDFMGNLFRDVETCVICKTHIIQGMLNFSKILQQLTSYLKQSYIMNISYSKFICQTSRLVSSFEMFYLPLLYATTMEKPQTSRPDN